MMRFGFAVVANNVAWGLEKYVHTFSGEILVFIITLVTTIILFWAHETTMNSKGIK